MDPEAEIWLQRLKQLLKNIQNQRNDLDFQKFCYQYTKYFRKSEQNWQQQLFLNSILKRVEPLEDLYNEGLKEALDKAIVTAVGIHHLEDVMQTLVNVLTVDNLSSKLQSRLRYLGYTRQRIKTMNIIQLQYLQRKMDPNVQQIDLRKIKTSLFKHTGMNKYDLLLINPSRFEGFKLPILILVRLKKILVVKKKNHSQNHLQISIVLSKPRSA